MGEQKSLWSDRCLTSFLDGRQSDALPKVEGTLNYVFEGIVAHKHRGMHSLANGFRSVNADAKRGVSRQDIHSYLCGYALKAVKRDIPTSNP